MNMKIAIIVSLKDKAGLNIKDNLIEHFNFKRINDIYENNNIYELNKRIRLYTTKKGSVLCENIDNKISADLFIFATKHQSKSGIASLCAHSPGNFFTADFGGKDNELCVCPANYLKCAVQLLEKNNVLGYDVIQEVTHHGPYMNKPVMFIEIGSSETEWSDVNAGRVIAKTIIELINGNIKEFRSAVGIGGLHHTPNFKKIILKSDISIGHVCPKYMLEHLTKQKVFDAMNKTVPKSEFVIVDYKGLGKYKKKVKDILDDIDWKRTKDY